MRGIEQIPWIYDASMFFIDRLAGLGRWRSKLAASAHGRTLEVGCGTGRTLARLPPGAVGFDPSLDVVRAARRRAPAALVFVASAEALPFRSGDFDTIVSSLVFCSVPDPAKGLAEVKRVLATDGEFRMMEHVRSKSRLGGKWQDFIQPIWTRVLGGCHPNRDTVASVARAGFTIDPATYRERGTMRRFTARRA